MTASPTLPLVQAVKTPGCGVLARSGAVCDKGTPRGSRSLDFIGRDVPEAQGLGGLGNPVVDHPGLGCAAVPKTSAPVCSNWLVTAGRRPPSPRSLGHLDFGASAGRTCVAGEHGPDQINPSAHLDAEGGEDRGKAVGTDSSHNTHSGSVIKTAMVNPSAPGADPRMLGRSPGEQTPSLGIGRCALATTSSSAVSGLGLADRTVRPGCFLRTVHSGTGEPGRRFP